MDLRFADYGQERDVDCTEEERNVFEIVRATLDYKGLDASLLHLTRKSNDYLSIVMGSKEYGPMDVARFKYTNRAKWIKMCPDFDKIPLLSTDDVGKCADLLVSAYRFNEPYL